MSIWTELNEVAYSVTFVDAGGLRTRALQSGSGEDIVFLHGTSGHLEAFARNIPAHAEHYRCHAVDMMGHGYTDSPQRPYRIAGYVEHMIAYLDAVGIDKAHFVGESLGGWVAARLAVDHPEHVGKLTLVAPGGTVANPEVMARIKNSTRAAVENDDLSQTRQRLELLMYDPAKDVSDELVEIRHAIYHRPTFVAAIDRLLALQEMENRRPDLLTEEQMGAIAAPTLIVWGAENPFGEVPEAERMRKAIPGSRLEIFERCGHWPQHEHAARFNDLHLGFLADDR